MEELEKKLFATKIRRNQELLTNCITMHGTKKTQKLKQIKNKPALC